MKMSRIGVTALAVAVSSCGGGGGSSGGGTGGGPAPIATLTTTLSTANADVIVPEGQTANFGFTASYTGAASGSVVPDVQISDRRFVLTAVPTSTGSSSFDVKFKTNDFAPGGKTTTTGTFRLCTDASCSTVYPGSSRTFTVNLDVQVGDWTTTQRNIAHTAYVPVRYNVADFKKAWDWIDTDTTGWIHSPAAVRGRTLITVGRDGGMAYNGTTRLISFDTAAGSKAWTTDLGNQFYTSGPTVAQDLIHVTSMETSSNVNPEWVFDLNTGAFKAQMKFAAQWTSFQSPVASGKQVFVAAGYFGNVLFGFDATTETKIWETQRAGALAWGGQSMALDDKYLYFSTGSGIEVYDRNTGALLRNVVDPGGQTDANPNESGPMLGNGMAFVFLGSKRFEDSATIAGLDLASGTFAWRSTSKFAGALALKDGVLFGARNDAHALSAINAATGQVLWSALLPTSDTFVGNVVVTENLAFISTAQQTWAVDIKASDHPIVWTAPTGGRLVITPDNYLLTTGFRDSRKLTAYKLF